MKIEINLLGRFEIFVDGHNVISDIGGSKKGILLLEYLILNTKKTVTSYDLYEVLWPESDISNPVGSLKTLVSRVRTTLSGAGLKNAVLTASNSYKWNTALDATVDVFEFDKVAAALEGAKELNEKTEALFERVLELYVGDILPGASYESWVVSRSVYYHNLYLKLVSEYLKLLKAAGRSDDVVRVARTALEIDTLESSLHTELMEALLTAGRGQDAMAQYTYANDLYSSYLGVQPTENILNFYKKLIVLDSAADDIVDEIRRDIKDDDSDDGAFVCEYAILKDIYNLNHRIYERTGTPIFVALVTVSDNGGDGLTSLMRDKIMKLLEDILKTTLRKGDTVARYSPTQYALLLPGVNHETGCSVLERVKQTFYRELPSPSMILSYRLRSMAD